MLAKLRPRSAYDVMAALALFVALSTGSAYAVNEWTGANIVDESLTGADVKGKAGTSTPAVNGSLTTVDIAGQQANAANGTPFVDGTLTQWDVRNGSLTGGDLANNTVGGGKVANESLLGSDVQDGSLSGFDVSNDSLTGADVIESSLGEVRSAAVGGRGAASIEFTCDPDDGVFVSCGFVNLNVPSGAFGTRALLVARIEASAAFRADEKPGRGFCRLVTSTVGPVPNSTVDVFVRHGNNDYMPLIGVTEPLIPGQVNSFGIECSQANNQFTGEISFREAAIEAVLINF